MKNTTKARRLLEKMGEIQRMERGKICQMRGREHFNHQTWQAGRNVVRYVPCDQVAELQKAIDGYREFSQLAEKYVDEIVKLTRTERARKPKHPTKAQKRTNTAD